MSEREYLVADRYGFHQRGHWEPVEPTPEQIAQHARAVEIIEEFETNPYLWAGYDGCVDVQPLQTERWVPEETHEEWMARWHEYVRTHGWPSERTRSAQGHPPTTEDRAILAQRRTRKEGV